MPHTSGRKPNSTGRRQKERKKPKDSKPVSDVLKETTCFNKAPCDDGQEGRTITPDAGVTSSEELKFEGAGGDGMYMETVLQGDELEELIRDASARIIQIYWREKRGRITDKKGGMDLRSGVEEDLRVFQESKGDHIDYDMKGRSIRGKDSLPKAIKMRQNDGKVSKYEASILYTGCDQFDHCDAVTNDQENVVPVFGNTEGNFAQYLSHDSTFKKHSTDLDILLQTDIVPAAEDFGRSEVESVFRKEPAPEIQGLSGDTHCRASEKVQSIMDLLRKAESQDSCAISHSQGQGSDCLIEHHKNTPSEMQAGQATCSTSVKSNSAQLAESIYHDFKNKVQLLRKTLQERDATIQRLNQEYERNGSGHKKEIEMLQTSHACSLERQKKDHEADLAQRLQFIDALLMDKDKLSSKCEKLLLDVKTQQENHQKEIMALKQRWSDEFKKQKEAWQASERGKKDQWQAQKKKEITELTAKAMEPKLLQMAENYSAETNRLKERIYSQERLLEEHEKHSMQLRDRLIKEREDAVEKERMGAHSRFLQEKERHKMEISALCDKHASELEREKRTLSLKLEDVQRQQDEQLQNQLRKASDDLKKLRDETEKEKVDMEQQHAQTISRVRVECGAEREGWKEAVRERAERQMVSELERRKKLLDQERDEEIEMILRRLEEEKRSMREDFVKKDASHAAERQITAQAMLKRESDMEAKVKSADNALKAANDGVKREQQKARDLSEEVERKEENMKWLEDQLKRNRQESIRREEELLEQFGMKEKSFRKAIEDSAREKVALSREMDKAREQVLQLKHCHQAELSTVESQVKGTLSIKDTKIASLQHEIAGKQSEIRSLKNTLLKQKEDLET